MHELRQGAHKAVGQPDSCSCVSEPCAHGARTGIEGHDIPVDGVDLPPADDPENSQRHETEKHGTAHAESRAGRDPEDDHGDQDARGDVLLPCHPPDLLGILKHHASDVHPLPQDCLAEAQEEVGGDHESHDRDEGQPVHDPLTEARSLTVVLEDAHHQGVSPAGRGRSWASRIGREASGQDEDDRQGLVFAGLLSRVRPVVDRDKDRDHEDDHGVGGDKGRGHRHEGTEQE